MDKTNIDFAIEFDSGNSLVLKKNVANQICIVKTIEGPWSIWATSRYIYNDPIKSAITKKPGIRFSFC